MLDDLNHSRFNRGESFAGCHYGFGLERHLRDHLLDGLLQLAVLRFEGSNLFSQRVQLFGLPLLPGILLHVVPVSLGRVVVSFPLKFLLGLLVLFSEPESVLLPVD